MGVAKVRVDGRVLKLSRVVDFNRFKSQTEVQRPCLARWRDQRFLLGDFALSVGPNASHCAGKQRSRRRRRVRPQDGTNERGKWTISDRFWITARFQSDFRHKSAGDTQEVTGVHFQAVLRLLLYHGQTGMNRITCRDATSLGWKARCVSHGDFPSIRRPDKNFAFHVCGAPCALVWVAHLARFLSFGAGQQRARTGVVGDCCLPAALPMPLSLESGYESRGARLLAERVQLSLLQRNRCRRGPQTGEESARSTLRSMQEMSRLWQNRIPRLHVHNLAPSPRPPSLHLQRRATTILHS
jgi:hypothetical protein